MSEKEVTAVSESLDGSVMEEIGSPDDEPQIDEPNIEVVYDGELSALEPEEEAEEVEVQTEEEGSETEPSDISAVEDPEVVSEEAGSEASPDAQTTDTDEAQVVEAEGASPQEQTTREDFKYRVDGQEYEVGGAYVEDDKIVIPRESFQRDIQPRLADRNVWRQERSQLMQTIEDLNPERNSTVVQARTLLDKINETFKDEEAAYAFFKNFSKNRDKLILDAERAALEAEKKQLVERTTRDNTERQVAELVETMDGALESVLETAANLDSYKGVVDFGYVRELIEPIKESFFFEAPEDMPQYGLKKGEIGIRIDRIESIIQKEAQRAKASAAATAASRRNDAAIGDSPENEEAAPATPEPTSPVVVTQDRRAPQTREEWEENLAQLAAGR